MKNGEEAPPAKVTGAGFAGLLESFGKKMLRLCPFWDLAEMVSVLDCAFPMDSVPGKLREVGAGVEFGGALVLFQIVVLPSVAFPLLMTLVSSVGSKPMTPFNVTVVGLP